MVQLLEKNGVDGDGLRNQELEEAYKEGQLSASVTLHFKGRSGEKKSPLTRFAVATLNASGLTWRMEFPNKEPLTSKTSKLSKAYYVQTKNDIPLPKSVFDRMWKMLCEAVKTEEILPDP